MTPTLGRIVHYSLTEEDAEKINRRRTTGPSVAARIAEDTWPLGAQAHIGNEAHAGQIVPAIIVAVWSENCFNAQAFLDGNDTLWLLSRSIQEEGDPSTGNCFWPPRV